MRIVILLFAAVVTASAQPGIITTIAGAYWTGDGGPALRSRMMQPASLDVDRDGNIYVMDPGLNVIWKITPSGIASIFAGTGRQGFNGDGLTARETNINPNVYSAVRATATGELLFADNGNHRVRRVSKDGTISTIVGTGTAGFSGDGGLATAARIDGPTALALDSSGTIYVGEGCRIRRVSLNGLIETVAGASVCGDTPNSSSALESRLRPLQALAVNDAGVVFWSQAETANDRSSIRMLAQGIQTLLHTDSGVGALLASGDRLTFAGQGNQVKQLAADSSLTIIAGSGRGFAGDGGPARTARFQWIYGLAFEPDGSLLVGDAWNHRVRRIDQAGIVTTICGADPIQGNDGPSPFSRLDFPRHIALRPNGEIVVAHENLLRVVADGVIKRLAGDGINLFSGDNGPAADAQLDGTTGLAVDADGNVYVGQDDSGVIRRITPDGVISRYAGSYLGSVSESGDGGPALEARFKTAGLAFDASRNLYIADAWFHRVRRIDKDGIITVIAGNGQQGFAGDGGPAKAAQLNNPNAVAVDRDGNVYIADTDNHRIRKVSKEGIISTIAGGPAGFLGDGGEAALARLRFPHRLCFDRLGNLYVSDRGSHRIRRITQNGIIATAVGTGRAEFNGDGIPAILASLNNPTGIVVDNDGNLYIADFENHRIRKVQNVVSLSATPAALTFTFSQGASTASQFLTVNVADRESRPLDLLAGAAWLQISPTRGEAPGLFTVRANPAGLRPGSYATHLKLTNLDNTRERLEVPVLMTISGSQQQIQLSQAGLAFAAVQNGPSPPAQVLRVLNSGIGTLDWQVTTSTVSGGGWLEATPARGRTDQQQRTPSIDVRVNPAALAPGVYYGLVTVSAPGVDNSPQALTVVFRVFPSDQPPEPVIYPNGLVFTTSPNASRPSQSIEVSNVTAANQTVTASAAFSNARRWFEVSTAPLIVARGQTVKLDVRLLPLGIPVGVYTGSVNLTFNPGNLRRTVTALLVVSDALAADASKTALRSASTCTPTRWLPVFRQPGATYSVTAGWPVPVEVEVVDDCGMQMASGSVAVSFSHGDPPLPLRHISEGRWMGTWASRNSRPSGVNLTARADSAAPLLTGEARITGGVAATTDQPLIAPRGIQNEASRNSDATAAIGTRIRILGSKLAAAPVKATGAPLPLELGSTSASIGGRPVALLAVDDDEIAAILPYGLAANTTHQLIVRSGTRLSPPEPVLITSEHPAVFTVDGTGRGQAQAFVMTESGLALSDLARPAREGELVVVLAAGLGAVSPSHEERNAAPEGSTIRALAPIKAEIQGREAEVESATLAPGLVGMYRVVVIVPAGMTPDPAAQLRLKAGEVVSPAVTLAVN